MEARGGVLVYDEAPSRLRGDPTRGFRGTIGRAFGAIST